MTRIIDLPRSHWKVRQSTPPPARWVVVTTVLAIIGISIIYGLGVLG